MSLQQLAQNLKQQANTSASHYITLDDHILQRSDGGISQLIKDSLLREQGNIILVIKPDDIPDTPPDTGFELKGITPNTDTDVFLKLKNQSVTLNFVVVNSKIEFKLTIKLTESWQFSNSFDAVSVLVFDSLLSQGEESGLLSEKEFIFSSFQESQTTENLEAGLNFSAQIQLMGVLGYITDLLPQTTPSLPTGETGNSPNQYTLKGAIRQNQNTHQPEFDLKADLNVATLNLPNQQPILEISDLCVGANLTYVQSSDQEEKWESFPQLYLGGEITLENSSGTKMPLEIRGFLPDRPRLSLINFAIFPSEKDRLSTSLDRIGSLVGGHSWDNFFQGDSPELQTLHNCLKTFGLKSFATSISIEKFSVLSISVNVGTLEPWSFFEGQFQIKYFDLSWMIIDPLDKSIMFVTLATELELFNDNQFIFDITVQVPDLRISGAYKGQISFSFKSLVDKITSFFEIESLPLPDDLATFSFSNLYTEINVPSKVFSLSGNADISLHPFGIELLGLHQVYFFVSYDKQNKTKPLQASLTGIITILGLDFYVDAEIREKVTFQIHMVNQTFGSLLGYLVKLVDPDIDFTLDAPWDILNSIKMDSLVLNINITDGIVNLKYTTDLDLEFIVITAFDLSYFKAKGSVDIAIECKFLGQSYGANNPLKWDALNESPPSVSGKTTTLDLRFLAVGQHIAFKDTTEFTKVYDVLNKLGDSYKPQDISKGTQKQLSGSTNSNQPVIPNGDKSPIKSPLDPLDALQFDPNAGWLIGADLTLVDAVTVGVIFNDPELYGLYISLSGPKVKILDGLSFQILYKKINDHLGEYFLELKLPDIMRHWEFGEVSLTLPIIDISIYTNGNFKLDFGFPYNNDFSRSFSVQAFPFEGAGGFYFAMLNGDTSNHVPVISNGRFDPVIEFGLGLQIGVGKDINEGVLSAGIDITLAGVLQGVIAVFNPDSNALVPENYYLIQGAIAIVGKLYGKIDLAIIKIDISVTLYASVQLVVECYQPIYITLSAGVEVRAFIQIVFIKIDFHFSATITQKFSIGQASPTPWNVISPPQPLPSLDTSFSPQPVPSPEPPKVRPSPMMAAMATPTAQPVAQPVEPLPVSVSSRPIPDTVIERPLVLSATNPTDWTWSANFAYNDSSNKEVKLYFVPCVTASSKGVDGTVDPQVVSLLFLENSINQSQNNQTQSDFDKLAQTLLVWALQAYLKVADAASLNQAKITEDDLNFIDKRLSGVITEGVIAGLLNISLADATVILQSLVIQGVLGKNGSILDANKAFNLDQNQDQQVIANLLKSWQVPFGFDQLMGYLQTNFVFKVQDQSSNPTSINASIFPLFKSLNLGYKDKQTGESKVISFSQSIKDAFGEDYLPQLIKYLKALSSQQEESLEQDGVIISDESLAEVLFKDYFSLLINTAVQNAYRLLRAFSYQINEGDYLTRIVSQYYDVSEGGVTDNVGKYLLEMCLANQNQPGVLNDKGYAIIKQFTHQITTAETSFNQIAQTLSNSQIKVDIKALATSNLYNTHLLALGQSVSLPSVSYTAPPSDTTLTSLAQQFYTSADRIVILGGQPTRDITNNGDSPSLAPLTKVSISGINFSYNPTTGNLKSLAEIGHYFGVSETILQGLNPDFDATKNSTVTIPAINYTVPPTDINSVATYFGVGVEQVQQNGNQYTITNAQYTVDANDTLFSIARYFSVLPSGTLVVKPEDLVSTNADKKGLLQVGGSLVVQDYKCAIANRDTLANIAQNHYCALTDIITWNKDNPQLLKPQQIWVIPSVRLSVSQLIQTLASHPDAPNFNNIASTVSRFLVHGMSLPIAQQDFTQPLATWQVQSLYAAVGQQFSASVASLGDGVTLSVASSSPVLQLPDNATYKLTPDQLQFVQDLPTVAGKLQTNAIGPFTPFIKTNTQHSLQNSFLWNSVDHNIPFQSQQGSQSLAGNPTIWTLPAGLLHQLRQLGKQETLMLNLKTGSSDAQGRDMITTDVNYYAWATLIKFSVKEYISSGINGEMISNVYQLQGVDHDSVELLSRLLAAKEDNLTLYLVYTADNRGNSASLQSDMFAEGDSQGIQLIKTNLAGIGDQDPEIAAASLKEAQTFLRLLYESSDVQSGGYYLYYQTQQNPDGFPASVFSQSVNATLNLLVLSTDTNQVARSRNCVVTRTAIDTSQMVFFAESPQCPAAQLTISPGNIGFEWSLAKPDLEPKVSEVLVLDIGSQLKSGDDGITLTANTNATKAITTTPGVNPKKVVKFTIPANLTSNYLNIAFYVGDSFTHSEDLTKTNYIRCQVMAADASSVGKVIKISNGHHPRPQPQEVTLTDSWQLVEQFIPADQLVSDPNTTSPFVIFVNPTSADESFSFYVSLEPGELTYLEKQNSSLELAAFESLFQMLGYRVQENADFGNGMWAVPLGPTLPHDAAKVPLGESTDADWHYSHIIPLPSPKSSPTEGQSNAFMPSADENPYRAITKTIKSLEFTFNLQDVYGNRLTNIFKDSLSIPIQYYDPVIPLSQWNSVAASYTITGNKNDLTKPLINVLIDFNGVKYLPRLDKSLSDCLKQAQKDLEGYKTIYYQLSQGDVSVFLETSLGNIDTPSQKDPLVSLIAQIYGFLTTLTWPSGGLIAVTHTTGSNNTTDSLSSLAQAYPATFGEIAQINATIPDFFASDSLNIPTFYTVRFKDTLASIVANNPLPANSGVTAYNSSTVASLNQDLPGLLRPGVLLVMGNDQTHLIAANDTLASIAKQYNSTVESLASLIANQDILASGAHIALFVEQKAPGTGKSITDLANSCTGGATITEFTRFNGLQPIKNNLILMIPNALILADNLPKEASIYAITDQNNTLGKIAVNEDHIKDLFNVNLYLMNIIQDKVTFSVDLDVKNPDGSWAKSTVQYTTKESDNLYSIYTFFVAQVSLNGAKLLTTQAQFASLIKDVALFKQVTVLMPPTPLTLSSTIQPQNHAEIFSLTVSLKITRDPNLVSKQLLSDQKSQQLIEQKLIEQTYQSVLQAETPIVAHTEGDQNNILSLQQFAIDFETAFDQKLKVAVSKDTQDSNKKIWIVPLGNSGISYQITDAAPQFFAPQPLANQLISRSDVMIKDYLTNEGLQGSKTLNFTSVNLDEWGRQFLTIIDEFMTAKYAVGAYHLDEESFDKLVGVKQRIAKAIAQSVTNILETDDSSLQQRQLAAQQTLYEQLLDTLSSAYNVDAIIQYQTQSQSPYQQADKAPLLLGKIEAANYTITQGINNLQTLLTVYQQPNPGLTLDYLTLVLQDVPGIFDLSQTIKLPNQPEYRPTKEDTLATVAHHFNLTITGFAQQIAQQNLLLPGKTLSLNWVVYPQYPILQEVANYFEVTSNDIIFANLATPNLINAGQNLGTYTTKDNDTFQTILQGLGISLDNLITASLPNELINNANLFKPNARIGVLELHGKNQPDFSLSTAEFSLSDQSSWLNCLFTQSGQKSNRIFLDLDYSINSLALYLDEQEVPLYLTFLLPLQPLQMGQAEIPIPLRNYPTAPVLIGQNGEPFNDDCNSIEEAKQWTYTYTYQQQDEAQDEIEANIRFNVREPQISSQTNPSQLTNLSTSQTSDLFEALAAFIHAYDAMESDLALIPTLKPDNLNPAIASTLKIALQAFVTLAEQVATNWETWQELQANAPNDTQADFSCLISEYIDPNTHQLTITVQRLQGTANLPLVIADSDKWQPQGSPSPQPGDRAIYTFIDKDNTQKDRGYRQLKFGGLNIISQQNTWGGIRLTRNQDLVSQAKTNPAFIYQTPAIRFANRFTPLLTITNKISIAQTQHQKPLVEHLSNLFNGLLELTALSPTSDLHQIKIACDYAFSPSGAIDDETMLVRVPVLLQPQFVFQLRDGMVNDPASSQDSFVKRLADELEDWQQTHAPNSDNQSSTFIFEITLFSNVDTPTIQEKLLNFLVKNNNLYRPNFNAPTVLPLSFYAEDNYWTTSPNNQEDLYSIEAITERLIVHYGADIYDVSTMQIALSLYPDFSEGVKVARDWTRRLKNNQSGFLGNIRGWTHQISYVDDQGQTQKETVFVYGGFPVKEGDPTGHYIMLNHPPDDQPNPGNYPNGSIKSDKNQPGAYYFRSISDQYYLTDPYTGFATYPDGASIDGTNQLHWTDWKPITGENAWSCLLGPLQVEYNLRNGQIPPYNSEGVQLALNVLPAFKAMMSPDGGIYYAPQGTAANIAGQMVDPLQLSNENNFSSFAGLTLLLEMLTTMMANEPNHQAQIKNNLKDVMEIAKGIKNYFQTCLYNPYSGFFFTQGTYNNPTKEFVGGEPIFSLHSEYLPAFQTPHPETITNLFAQNNYRLSEQFILEETQPKQGFKWVIYDPADLQTFFVLSDGKDTSDLVVYGETFAVDVHTWGMAVLGVDNIDTWFGTGAKNYTVNGIEKTLTAYDLWQRVKQRAGYFQDGDRTKAILGVGYTDVPTNLAEGSPYEYIISGEWTFGAINLCRVLAAQYAQKKDTQSQQWSKDLAQDAENMTHATRYLLLDSSRNEQQINAYYYANRRYFIPFGWYANRIDSLTSTAWGVMIHRHFNPFVLGGAYDKSPINPAGNIPIRATSQITEPNFLLSLSQLGIPQEQQKRLNFLLLNNTRDRSSKQAPFASQTGMPLSFYVPEDFWTNLGKNNTDYAKNQDSVEAVTERVLTHYGLNIYDAATMQIALAIFPQFTAGMAVAKAQTQRLLASSTIPAYNSSIRGWTKLDQPDTQRFYYGKDKKPIYPENRQNTSPGAFYFRSISDQYALTDPLNGKNEYPNGQTVENQTAIHWIDWKPITGENAWAALIAPLQVAFAEYGNFPPLDSDAVKLALNVLPAYEAMVSDEGGLFYAPWNMAGNESGTIADALGLSNENNFSSYAGLQMLKSTLEAGGDTHYLPLVTNLINGLDQYFQTCLFDANNQVFVTCGTYNNPLNKFIPGNQLFEISSKDFSALIFALEDKDMKAFNRFLYIKYPLSDDLKIVEVHAKSQWNIQSQQQNSETKTVVSVTLTINNNIQSLSLKNDQGIEVLCLYSNDQQTLVDALTNANAANLQDIVQRLTNFPFSTNLIIKVIPIDNHPQINQWEILDQDNKHTLIALTEIKAGITTVSLYGAYLAVDVHTWGCSVLGVEKVDTWFKEHNITAYGLWQTIKARAGYFQDNDPTKLCGVGYTDAQKGTTQNIISAEWTFGAINMCLLLAAQYSQEDSEHYQPDWAKGLRDDANSMYEGVKTLLLDQRSMSDETEAYYYANKRYQIPFGWYANPIDSLCSTAWSLMIDNGFNPFMLGGSYTNTVTFSKGVMTTHQTQPLLQLKNLYLRFPIE